MLFQRATILSKIFLIVGLFIANTGDIWSQSIKSASQEKIFYDLPNGLSQKNVNVIYQDFRGFLWIGTDDGLNKFDGYDVTVYRHSLSDGHSISHNLIRALAPDGTKGLWIGTERGGLNHYNFQTDQFSTFDGQLINGALLSNCTIYDLEIDNENNIWIATNHGLALFDTEINTLLPIPISIQELVENHVHILDVFLDSRGVIWIGTDENGLWSIDSDLNKTSHYQEGDLSNDIQGGSVRSIFESRDGILWVGTDRGLNRYDEFTKKFIAYDELTDINIWAIAESADNEITIGTDGDGLKVLLSNGQTQSFRQSDVNQFSLNDNVIRDIFRDRQGNLWIGTFRGGVNLIHNQPNKFKALRKGSSGLNNKSILAISKQDSEGIWIGTDGGGLNHLNLKTGIISQEPNRALKSNADNVILSIMEDHEGGLWTGTYNGGIRYITANSGTVVRFATNNSQLINNSVLAIHQDIDKNIWIGTNGGINYYDWQTKTLSQIPSKSSQSLIDNENSVRTIFEDKSGDLWFGIMGGVKKFNYITKKFEEFLFEGFQRNYLTYSIHEDSDGILWIGTFGGGLLQFDPERGIVNRYEMSDGLPSDIIHGILEDGHKNLWLSTGAGICRFNPATHHFRNYGVQDGLQGNQFNRASYLKDDAGYFWFGGTNGLNVFHPDSIFNNLYVPATVFTDLKVFNQSVGRMDTAGYITSHINSAEKIELDYSHSVFTIEFASLNYVFPERNQYAFLLEGFDLDWRYTTDRREATYTNLDPGSYTFKVKSANNDGLWNDTPTSIKIIVFPPWWKTWWAYTIYLITILCLLIWARQLIVHRERLKLNLKLDHLELTHLQEMDHMKSKFFANISHELRTPLTLILDPLKLMYDREAHPKAQKQLKTMIRNAQRLVRLINQLLDLSKIETGNMRLEAKQSDLVQWFNHMLTAFSSFADQHSIKFKISLPSHSIVMLFDQDKLEKIVSNLLSNALKFTRDKGAIELSVKKVRNSDIANLKSSEFQDWVEIKVEDTGVGIPKDRIGFIFDRFYQVDGAHHREQEGTGIGLSLTKELVELHQGYIYIKSEEGKGTEAQVYIPIIVEDKNETVLTALDGRDEQRLFNQIESTVGSALPNIAGVKAGKSSPLLLIVEDNADVSSYICSKLGNDFRTNEALNGKLGFEKALQLVPDLIISDVMMPEMNGIEMTKLLKQDPRTSHIPIILLTAKAEDNDIFDGIDVGADDYIVKPFDSRFLEVRVRNLIESRARLKASFASNRVIDLEPKEITATPVDELFLKKALESVEENMSNSDYSVEDFGNDVGLSRMQLYRKLKGLTDQSPNEFIRTVRLKRAAQLIQLDQMTISQITYEVGFNDLQYFRDCFKKHFGLNPSDYGKVPSETST